VTPGARFLLWDRVLPTRPNPTLCMVAVPLTVVLRTGEVQAGYGVRLPPVRQDVACWTCLGEKAGRTVASAHTLGETPHIKFVRPKAM
jgi:hypothetical protein